MRSGFGMILGLGIGIAGFLVALRSEDGGSALVGMMCALVGMAGWAWAFVCYEKRLEQEERGECLFSLARGTFMGLVIPLWFLICLGVAVLCLLQWVGLIH